VIIPSLRLRTLSARLSYPGLLLGLFLLPTLGFHKDLLIAQKSNEKPYALIAGTVWGPDDRPVYGVTVRIRRATDKPKKVRWEVFSDHHGEFAQRVPAGETDYILSADVKHFKLADGKPVRAQEVTVHVYNDEREDTGLHLTH
jgi:hypothetical protein